MDASALREQNGKTLTTQLQEVMGLSPAIAITSPVAPTDRILHEEMLVILVKQRPGSQRRSTL